MPGRGVSGRSVTIPDVGSDGDAPRDLSRRQSRTRTSRSKNRRSGRPGTGSGPRTGETAWCALQNHFCAGCTGHLGRFEGPTADIGFLAYDPARAREADFGAAFEVMFNSYLVRSDSPIKKSADVDRTGVKVAAVKGQTQELFVSSHLKKAQVRVFQTMPPQADVERLLGSREVDVFAINRQRSLDAQAASGSKLRALSDSFLEVEQCFVVEKGARAKLDAIEKFVAELRSSGFIKVSIDRAKLTGVDVASGKKR